MDVSPLLHDSCRVAFKEWAGVCHALKAGRQSIILRKGGIAEGPEGFVPEHKHFWLYPTHVHEARHGIRPCDSPAARTTPEPGFVEIDALAEVRSIHYVDRVELLAALEPYHVWTDETVKARFAYRRPGLWVLLVRIHRAIRPCRVGVLPEWSGCKTWVTFASPITATGPLPVLDDIAFSQLESELRALLPSSN
jgi:hypothetical protein